MDCSPSIKNYSMEIKNRYLFLDYGFQAVEGKSCLIVILSFSSTIFTIEFPGRVTYQSSSSFGLL